MSGRPRQRNVSANEQALAAFVARKHAIDTMLARLQALGNEHFGLSPDEITWGHVTALADYSALLKRITDQAFKEDGDAD